MRSPGNAAAHLLAGLRLDGPALDVAAWVLHRMPRSRAAASLGWHLGQVGSATRRVARLHTGSRMAVDVRDYGHRHAFLFGVYEEQITALITRLSRPAWTVVDVGANAGYHALLAADLGGRGSRIVAFEPNPQVGALLERTLALNPAAGLELVPAACAEHDGTISFLPSSDPHNSGLSHVREDAAAGGTSVACVRLDRFCEEHRLEPALIKIDVEGAEAGVLRGAESLLRTSPPAHVICEVWPDTRAEVFDLMAAHGYDAHGIASDGSLVEAPEPSAAWCDVCFVHRGPPGSRGH